MITFFLAGGFTNNGPLFLSDSDSEDEDDFTAFMVEIFRLIFVSRKTMGQWRQEICNKRVKVSINTKVRLILVHGSWFLHRVLGHV